METTQIIKKSGKIALNVLLYLFIIVCVFGVVMTISSKGDADDTATIFGRQMRVVLSPSMEKCDETDVSEYDIKDIPTGSMVFIEVVPEDPEEAAKWYDDIKIGDVLTFKYVYVKQETITHRVTGIRSNPGGGYTIRLDGDNKSSDSETLTQVIDTSEKNSPNYIIGKVTGQSYLLGVTVNAMRSPIGLVFIVILPSLIIAAWEVLKLVKMFNADKRAKEKESFDRQQSEIEELKRRLAAFEGASQGSTDTPETVTTTSASDADTESASDGNNG